MRVRLNSDRGAGAGTLVGGIAILIVVLVLGFVIIRAFAYEPVAIDEIGVQIGGGPFDGKNAQVKNLWGPGLHRQGFADGKKTFPTSARNFVISTKGGHGDLESPVRIVTKDTVSGEPGATVEMVGGFRFKLNTGDLDRFKKLYADYLKRYKAWDYDSDDHPAWSEFLRNVFQPSAVAAVASAGKDFTPAQLSRPNIDYEARVGELTNANLRTRYGDDFFCGPDYDRVKAPAKCTPVKFEMTPIALPTGLTDAANRIAVAEANQAAAQKEKLAIDALKGQLTPEYVAYLCFQQLKAECPLRTINGPVVAQ